MTGYTKNGALWESSFEPTVKGFKDTVNYAYDSQFIDFNPIMKAAGMAGFNTGDAGNALMGMFNTKYGKKVSAIMYTGKKLDGIIQKRGYDHQGMRLLSKYATYGKLSDIKFGEGANEATPSTLSDGTLISSYGNDFFTLGSFTAHEGKIPNSIRTEYEQINVPYKELPFAWDYGLAMKALEVKDDDTTTKDYYAKTMANNFDNQINLSLCAPISTLLDHGQKPSGGTRRKFDERGLTPLSKVLCSAEEVGKKYKGMNKRAGSDHTVCVDDVCTWGGFDTSDMKDLRFASGDLANNEDGSGVSLAQTHVPNTHDVQYLYTAGQPLSLDHIQEALQMTQPNWEDDDSGKCWLFSPSLWMRASKLATAYHVDTTKQYTKLSVNGVSTPAGTDFGYLLDSLYNVPVIREPHLTFNYDTGMIRNDCCGEAYLLDTQSVFLRVLTPMQMWTVENPAITRSLIEKTACNMRAELAADKWITSCKLAGFDAA